MAFTGVIADDLGIYAVTGDGSLVWYRDTLRNGTNDPHGATGWSPSSGSQIGGGWDIFRQIFSGADGIIYAIKDTGELLWYRDTLRNGMNGPNGTAGWAAGSGNQIGAGWQNFAKVFSGGNGVIYAIKTTGELLWYRDTLRNGMNGPNGTAGWATGSGNQIGAGWHNFPAVVAPGAADGIIYATTQTADLRWYRDDLRNGTNGAAGTAGWAPGSGANIGLGWSIEPRTLISGYPVPLSVARGASVALHLSARTIPVPCTVTVTRLRENADGSVGVPVGPPIATTATHQTTSPNAWQDGCGWPATVSVPLDPTWRSGLYSARVTAGAATTDVVFVVRPGAVQKDLLLLANTNCWNSYNAWGGASNYSGHADVVTLSFERPNPETVPRSRLGTAYVPNHLTAAELWFSTWLEDAGYEFDTCSDLDLHLGDPHLSDYKGVILSTHPEYWTIEMAARLSDYVATGGRVLYLGGNGVFRKIEFAPDGRSMTAGSKPDWFAGNAWAQGPKPRGLLGVAYEVAHDLLYPARCGYVITQPAHKFLAGTGLALGDVIGAQGRNGGGACGWEIDTAIDFGEGNGATRADLEIIGHGELATPDGYTGHMTYYENAEGGFMFAIGSITVGGSVPVDTRLQRIVRNALDACLAETVTPVAAKQPV